jgi:hypothetical protein
MRRLRPGRGQAVAEAAGERRDGDRDDRHGREPGDTFKHPAAQHPAAHRGHPHRARWLARRRLEQVT